VKKAAAGSPSALPGILQSFVSRGSEVVYGGNDGGGGADVVSSDEVQPFVYGYGGAGQGDGAGLSVPLSDMRHMSRRGQGLSLSGLPGSNKQVAAAVASDFTTQTTLCSILSCAQPQAAAGGRPKSPQARRSNGKKETEDANAGLFGYRVDENAMGA